MADEPQRRRDNEQAEGVDRRVEDLVALMELDRFTIAIVGELEARDVRPILLKGPTFAKWLYQERTDRPYGDADIYVGPEQWRAAVEALTSFGLVDRRAGEAAAERSDHAVAFSDPDGWTVDLHRAMAGCETPETTQWAQLSTFTDVIRLSGRDVTMLDETGRALHVALHAAQHGRSERKPIDDLERAVPLVTEQGWQAVARLAEDVGATPALAAGLRLVPAGVELAEHLGLPDDVPAHIRLRVDGGGGARAMNVAKIAAAPTLSLKLRYLWRWVFPSRTKMRRLSPGAEGSRRRLAGVYLRHLRRSPQAIEAVREWRQARPDSSSRD